MEISPGLYSNLIDDSLDYSGFLNTLKSNGYQFVAYNELNKPDKQVVIRHDIDFDCELAYQCALIEHKAGIKATYFFLVSSQSYNIASTENQSYINKIKELGHTVSLHFDPVIYTDFHHGFLAEKAFFETLFNVNINIISLHRPNDFFLKFNQSIGHVEHTYQDKYFKEIKYFSDSTGIWRFGHPFNSDDFMTKKSLHILIHPIWWMVKGSSNAEKIKTHFLKSVQLMKDHYLANCLPFKEVYNEV